MDRRWGRRDRDLCVDVGEPNPLGSRLLASSVAPFFGKIPENTSGQRTWPWIRCPFTITEMR